MVTVQKFREMALSYPDAVEMPHFEKASFRSGKKIFATLAETNKRVCVKLSEMDQSLFVSHDPSVIYAVPNKWGKQGWTLIDLPKVKKEIMVAILDASFEHVSSKNAKKKTRG